MEGRKTKQLWSPVSFFDVGQSGLWFKLERSGFQRRAFSGESCHNVLNSFVQRRYIKSRLHVNSSREENNNQELFAWPYFERPRDVVSKI